MSEIKYICDWDQVLNLPIEYVNQKGIQTPTWTTLSKAFAIKIVHFGEWLKWLLVTLLGPKSGFTKLNHPQVFYLEIVGFIDFLRSSYYYLLYFSALSNLIAWV